MIRRGGGHTSQNNTFTHSSFFSTPFSLLFSFSLSSRARNERAVGALLGGGGDVWVRSGGGESVVVVAHELEDDKIWALILRRLNDRNWKKPPLPKKVRNIYYIYIVYYGYRCLSFSRYILTTTTPPPTTTNRANPDTPATIPTVCPP